MACSAGCCLDSPRVHESTAPPSAPEAPTSQVRAQQWDHEVEELDAEAPRMLGQSFALSKVPPWGPFSVAP